MKKFVAVRIRKTSGIGCNYDKLMSNGLLPENTRVENKDVILGKVIPIKENRNIHKGRLKCRPKSEYRTTEEAY